MLVRLFSAYMKGRRWVDRTIAECQGAALPAEQVMPCREVAWFPPDAVRRTRVAIVDHVPRPPIHTWNLENPDPSAFFHPDGLTLDHLIFIHRGLACREPLLFHELVHVMQWRLLGRHGFLLLYGLLLLRFGYDRHPLEAMAFDLQQRFEASKQPFDARPVIARRVQETLKRYRRESWPQHIAALFVPRPQRG